MENEDQQLESAIAELKATLQEIPQSSKHSRAAIHRQISAFVNEQKRRQSARCGMSHHELDRMTKSPYGEMTLEQKLHQAIADRNVALVGMKQTPHWHVSHQNYKKSAAECDRRIAELEAAIVDRDKAAEAAK